LSCSLIVRFLFVVVTSREREGYAQSGPS
jgi:hypothetical protein